MADYEFRYSPLTGRLTGKQMIEQTEQAINQLSSLVNSAAGQVEIISTLANEANENAATALETAEEALATTGRTYITVSTQTDANSYYDSQLIYIADSTSTNIPVADTGMLEVKTNDNKTACEQVFISDSSGDAYYRNGAITAETVGDVTTYSVTWSGWSSQPASQAYVQGELTNYLPLAGGTVTGGLTVEGTITGNLEGNADTATNATNDANGSPIAGTYLPLAGGTMTGSIQYVENGKVFSIGNTDPGNVDLGWNWVNREGAGIGLRSADHLNKPGEFSLFARDSANSCSLDGKPDGSLTWNSQPLLPVGIVQAFAGTTIPRGWLLCDGSAVSRTGYAALYDVIGTTYGAGNGSTTFNLPNLVDKFVEGSATAGTVKSAGLPNITGELGFTIGGMQPTGAFGFTTKKMLPAVNGTNQNYSANIDASRSSSVYGKSTTVQPPALSMRYIIKY